MAKASESSLAAIQEQLASVLDERVTELMAQIKVTQALVRRVSRTEEEIERQRLLAERLEAELGPLTAEAEELSARSAMLQESVSSVKGTASRLREITQELAALQGSSGA